MLGRNKIREKIFSTTGFALLLIVFVIDLQTEIGITDGILYTGVLFLFIGISNIRVVVAAGVLAIALDILGYFISPRDHLPNRDDLSLTNHMFSIGILVVCDLLIIKYRMSIAVLRKKMQELKDFKHALDEAAMVAISDEEGNLLKVNDKFSEISKYTREDLVGRNHTIINSGPHAEKFIADLEQAVEKRKPLKGEYINRAKDGSYYWIDTTIVPFINEEGEIYQYVAIGSDVTVRKQIEEQLIRQKEELEKFLYISSHDLQEPLRKIQSFSSLIQEKEKPNLSDSGKRYLDKLSDAAARSRKLIQDLMAYADFNRQFYELESSNLGDITEQVKEELKDIITEKQASVTYFGNCRPAVIRFQFYQLIFNLVSNALKFSHPDIPPRINIKCRMRKGRSTGNSSLAPEKDYYHITVRDNGIGFAAKDKNKIFEIFKTLHGKDKYAGTGMGLAIVKRIVENHKGFITATAEVNKGAAFDIYIPASLDTFRLEPVKKLDGVHTVARINKPLLRKSRQASDEVWARKRQVKTLKHQL